MASTLWKHQQAALDFCLPKPASLLAMAMGTGKSLVTIRLLEAWGAKRVLIGCPLSVCPVWPSEFKKHASETGNTPMVLALDRGAVRARTEAASRVYDSPPGGVIVVNHEAMRMEPFASWALGRAWDAVVIDEVHRIKSPSSLVSRYCAKLGKLARRRLGLSGTPLATPLDAYAQYRFLDPSIFGWSFQRFRMAYAVMGGYGNYQILSYRNLDDLHKRFYSIAFRVTGDVLDLPGTVTMTRTCELDPRSRAVYDELEANFVAEVEEGKILTAANALVKLLRLQQLASGHVRADDSDEVEQIGDGKRKLLTEILEDLEPTEPVVVFAQFRADLDAIHEAAAATGRASLELSGRRKELGEWQCKLGGEVLATQIQSGGVGVDLTRSKYAIYYSTDFSLTNMLQSQARVHRPGQTHNVTYIRLVAVDTVDEKIYAALEKKEEIIDHILNQTKRKGVISS